MLVRIARFGLSRSIQASASVEAEMARMRLVAQRIDDPEVEPGERRDALVRQVAEVARIGQAAEAEAERGDVAMLLQERQRGDRAALPRRSSPACPAASRCSFEDRRIVAAGRRREAIAEARRACIRAVALVEIDVDALRRCAMNSAAQIVDAVGVVGMLMGVEHAVEPIDARRRAAARAGRARCRPGRA